MKKKKKLCFSTEEGKSLDYNVTLKEHSTFLKIGSFLTPQELNSWVLPFLNPFSRSLGLAVALLA